MMGSGGRPNGVGLPQNQRSVGMGSPRKLTNISRSEEYAIEFVDDDGQVHREIVHCIGGIWHRAPNGENYAAQLRPLAANSWLVKQLNDRVVDATSTATVPKADAVDVLGGPAESETTEPPEEPAPPPAAAAPKAAGKRA